jgi:hypothetical protein
MADTDCEDALTTKALFYIEKIIHGLVEKINFDLNLNLFSRYSTFIVKYSWCFLLLGSIICISLGLSAVLLRELPDFNDPSKVKFHS